MSAEHFLAQHFSLTTSPVEFTCVTRTWKNAVIPRVQNLPAFYIKPSRCASDRRS